MSNSVRHFIENELKLQTINLNDTLNVMKKNNVDPNYWEVTKQRGHWNQEAHKAVGIFLSQEIQKLKEL